MTEERDEDERDEFYFDPMGGTDFGQIYARMSQGAFDKLTNNKKIPGGTTAGEFDGKTDEELKEMIIRIKDDIKQIEWEAEQRSDEIDYNLSMSVADQYFVSELLERIETIESELSRRLEELND